MTTAPDMPLPHVHVPAQAAAAVTPAAATPERRALHLVPPPPPYDFDEAVGRAGPRLHRYAVRRIHDAHEAEEVVQEALLRAFQHRDELPTEDDLMAWLTVVTGRLVIDRLRVRGRSTPVAELPHGSRASRDTAEVVVARDEARLALDSLEAMPGRQASVLWAREVEGLSYDEIGDRFGMTEPSVRSLLHRARRTLRREYAARGGSLPAVGLVAFAPWLRGLRAAGRIRHAARRGAGATALAVTGIAAITISPFGSAGGASAAAPAMTPALHVRLAHAAHSVPTSRSTRHPSTPVRSTAARPAAPTAAHVPTSTRLPGLPTMCGARADGHEVSAGCHTHTAPVLFVRLPVPVAGNDGVGVAKDGGALCKIVPTTPLTKCVSGGNTGAGDGTSRSTSTQQPAVRARHLEELR